MICGKLPLAEHQTWHQSWYFLADTMTLTVKAVDAAKPREKAYKLTDAQGLYLFVTTTGAKSWRANYTAGGKQKTKTYVLDSADL